MSKYQNGKIYKIVCNINGDVYIEPSIPNANTKTPITTIASIRIELSAIERIIISFLIGRNPLTIYKGNRAQPLAQPIDDFTVVITPNS